MNVVVALQDTWARANREVIAKAVTELAYEQVIRPEITAVGRLRWPVAGGMLTGRARWREFGYWRVEPDSLSWQGPLRDGVDSAAELPDAVDLLAGILSDAGADPSTTAQFVAELAATLVSDAAQLHSGRPVADLLDEAPVLVEAELRGHPWIIANKGRVGFSVDDLFAYAPEAGPGVRLHWLAAAPDIADVQGLDHHGVVRDQVGDHEFARLRAAAAASGLDADHCAYLPVHPWQWTNRILALHAGDLARGDLVHLGLRAARYRPQLAIRTLTDMDRPDRRYLKLPLSVLNTSVYRGLPRERTIAAPALSAWLRDVVAADPFLDESGLVLLGEVASVSVGHRVYEAVPGVPYQHTEMLGAIWRESVTGYLRPGERAVSLAALLHVDPAGGSFAEALVARSGLAPADWVARLHEAVLPPLLHVLYRYGAMFSPHGQNCMIVHRDGVPTRLVVKDFVDDLAICAEQIPEHEGMPEEVRAALADVTLDAKTLPKYLQGGLLVCVYRYLAEIAADRLGVDEGEFWGSARAVLAGYQRRFAAELGDRFTMFDLRAPAFPKLCLNRLRLFEGGYRDDPERPVITAVGEVANPLYDGA